MGKFARKEGLGYCIVCQDMYFDPTPAQVLCGKPKCGKTYNRITAYLQREGRLRSVQEAKKRKEWMKVKVEKI